MSSIRESSASSSLVREASIGYGTSKESRCGQTPSFWHLCGITLNPKALTHNSEILAAVFLGAAVITIPIAVGLSIYSYYYIISCVNLVPNLIMICLFVLMFILVIFFIFLFLKQLRSGAFLGAIKKRDAVEAAHLRCIDDQTEDGIVFEPESSENPVAIVTGANDGLGFVTAKSLVKAGYTVVMGCRNQELALAAKEQIILRAKEELILSWGADPRDVGNHTNDVNIRRSMFLDSISKRLVYICIDLGDFASVQQFVVSVKESVLKCKDSQKLLRVVVNNAGVYLPNNNIFNKDGIIIMMAVNHCGPFLLSELLMRSIITPQHDREVAMRGESLGTSATMFTCRFVNVSSIAHSWAFSIPHKHDALQEKFKQALEACCSSSATYNTSDHMSTSAILKEMKNLYSISKFGNIMMTKHLVKQYGGYVLSFSLHPGFVRTSVFRYLGCYEYIVDLVCRFIGKSVHEGAATQIYLALAKDVRLGTDSNGLLDLAAANGHYFADGADAELTCVQKYGFDAEVVRIFSSWTISKIKAYL